MRKPIWSFANNQFVNSTKNSYRKAYILSIAHYGSLHQKTIDFPLDDDWATLYARYHTVHVAYRLAYNNWVSSGGTLSGRTKTLIDLLKLIPLDLDHWISLIIPVYNRNTSRFKALFPLGRTPFERGKIDVRISAIETLSTTIGTDVALAPAKVLVDATYTAIDGARTTQAGGKTSIKTNSETLEAARISAMNMQYRDTGFLIDKFYETPKSIEALFDLQTLRTNIQSYFTKNMGTTETYSVTKNTFVATDEIRAKVAETGNTTDSVTLYLASTLGGIDSTGITILNNAELKFAAIEFKVDLAVNTFLTAVTDGNITSVKLAIELY